MPADGGLVCTACHTSEAPANSDPRGRFTISTGPYTPGAKQIIRVALVHPAAARWGFQLTARPVSDETKQAGSFTVSGEVRVRCDADGRNAPCDGALEFASQTSLSSYPGTNRWSVWSVEWTPPATEAGDIVFHAAGAAANNNSNNQGDHIYSTKMRIPSATGCNLTGRPAISGVSNAASGEPGVSLNSLVSIYGSGFGSPAGRSALREDFVDGAYPKQLGCAAVEIAGKRAPIIFLRDNQINVQVPTTNDLGQVEVKVILNPGRPNEIRSESRHDLPMQLYSPAFFTFNGRSIASLTQDNVILADPSVVASGKTAKPGDIVSLFGTGFGVGNPVYQAGEIAPGPVPLRDLITVTVGGVTLPAADILYAGLAPSVITGIYQFTLRIPASTADGDVPVVIRQDNFSTQAGATIPVRR